MQTNHRCLSCEEQGYNGEDGEVSTPAHLCGFHTEHGPTTKRVRGNEVVDI